VSKNSLFRRLVLSSLLPLLVSLGCTRNGGGAFDARGYVNEKREYRVVGSESALLGDDWQLDNYYQRQPGGHWIQKDADDYVANYKLDLDGDGKFDETYRTYLYDLRWKHRKHNAVIWLRTFPISKDLRGRDLRVLMQGYIDEVAGAGYERVNIQSSNVGVVERRFAAAQLDQGTARVAGVEAFISTVDVVNVDQERVTPGQNRTRVRLALLRMPFEINPFPNRGRETLPVLMIAGYANLPTDFDGELTGFEQLLSSIEVRGKQGFDKPQLRPLKVEPAIPDASTAAKAEPDTSGAAGTEN